MTIRPVGAKLFHGDGRTNRQTDGHETNRCFLTIFRKRLRKGSRAEKIVSFFFFVSKKGMRLTYEESLNVVQRYLG